MSVNEKMTALADAIREKSGVTGKLTIDGMTSAVKAISSLIVASASGNPIVLNDSTDLRVQSLRLFGKTTQDGTPTPEAPVPLVSAGDGGSLGVTVAGKNLFENKFKSKTVNGVTFTVNEDGSVHVYGTPTKKYTGVDGFGFKMKTKGRYILSGGAPASGNAYFQINITKPTGTSYVAPFSNGVGIEFKIDGTETDGWASITTGEYTEFIDVTIYPMIRLASIADDIYEPYKQSQTLNLSTPNGLPGIPVTSGGNYTDETGQQWLCDEVDFTRGVYVQRIKQTVFNGSADEKWGGNATRNAPYGATITDIADCTNVDTQIVCDRYPTATIKESWSARNYLISRPESNSHTVCFRNVNIASLDAWKADISENPITIQYILATPIETPLSAEELAAYAALHTNYPNTTILNDGGAGMEVQYVADTKNYIDNQIAAVAAAIVNA